MKKKLTRKTIITACITICVLLAAVASMTAAYMTDSDVEVGHFTLNDRGINIASATVSHIENKEYTGKAITQDLEVTLFDEQFQETRYLVEGVDYEVEYKDNVEVGTAKMTIKGIGDYKGKIEATFKILEKKDTGKSEKTNEPASKESVSNDTQDNNAAQPAEENAEPAEENEQPAGNAAQEEDINSSSADDSQE